MNRRAWTRDELATLRGELLELAAAVAADSAFWQPSRAARQAYGTRRRPSQRRLRVGLLVRNAWRAVWLDWRWLALRAAPPSLLFGALAAERPFGLPSPWGAQLALGLGLAASSVAFAWDEEIRSRLGMGAEPVSLRRVLRILKLCGFIAMVFLSAGFSVFFLTALLPSLGVPHAGLFDAPLIAGAALMAGRLLFHTTSLVAEDGRSPVETLALLAGNDLRFTLGAAATFAPFLAGLGLTPACLGAFSLYNPAAAATFALLLLGGLTHANYLAQTYDELT